MSWVRRRFLLHAGDISFTHFSDISSGFWGHFRKFLPFPKRVFTFTHMSLNKVIRRSRPRDLRRRPRGAGRAKVAVAGAAREPSLTNRKSIHKMKRKKSPPRSRVALFMEYWYMWPYLWSTGTSRKSGGSPGRGRDIFLVTPGDISGNFSSLAARGHF